MASPLAQSLLDESPADLVAARWAALRALPLSGEPLSDEERAAFEVGARFLAAGERGLSPAEVHEKRPQRGDDRGE